MRAMVSRRQVIALFAGSPAFNRAAAAPQAGFSSGVNVVSMLVTVRDENGKIVDDLTAADFTVEEDGQPQTVTYFSRQDDLPLTLGLLVDTSESQWSVLAEELAASATFFQQVLREGVDQAFLTRFDERDLLLRMSRFRAPLRAAIGSMEASVRANPSIQGTLLYDAVADSADLIMKRLQGRKALVLLTDGGDMGSRHTLGMAIASCQRSDTAAYCIGIGTGLAKGAQALQALSGRTGGGYFAVGPKQDVNAIYRAIEEELRNQYNIGYVPPPPDAAGKNRDAFHKLRVTVKREGTTARTRDGYYSGG
jgi:VWFA-related protein